MSDDAPFPSNVTPRSTLHVKPPRAPTPLPIPQHLRTVSDALGAAKNLDLSNVLILSEVSDEKMIFLHAGSGEPLTSAQCLWLLAKAQYLLMGGMTPT